MKKLFLLLTMLLCLSFVSANLGYFEESTCVDVKTILNASSVTLSTLSFPNSTVAVSAQPMTKQGNTFNYTFCDTNTLGVYVYDYYDNAGYSYVNTFEITPNGEKPSIADAVFYLGLLALLIVGFGFIAYFGVSSNNVIAKTFSIGFGHLFLIGIFFVAWRMGADFLTSSPFLIDFLYYLFLALTIAFFPMLLILFAYGIYMAVTIKEINAMIDRGMPESEAAERVRWKK